MAPRSIRGGLNQRKPTTTFGIQKQEISKVSDAPLDMGLVLFVVWFSRRFLENQNNPRGNKKKNKNKPISKGASETFKNFVWGFPEALFGCLWFSLVCLVFHKFCLFYENLRENRKTNKTKPISKGGSETSNHFGCSV